jgi:hypothetical protein
MLILNLACSDSGSRLFDWSGRWTRFAAAPDARPADRGQQGRTKSLRRHQRRLAAPQLQIFTLSKKPFPGHGPRHVILRAHNN